MTAALPARFLEKCSVAGPDDCWNWHRTDSDGYGRFHLNGRSHRAHRVSYELLVGEIPAGLVIDHLCRNRACVNPAHMEPVTIWENVDRSPIAKHKQRAALTHCPNGHPYAGENLRFNNAGGRRCYTCRSAQDRARYEARTGRTVATSPRSHCQRGHAFEGNNLLPSRDGKRRCRTCHNLAAQRRNALSGLSKESQR